ncbi:unnamed protein product [Cercospora beticola]|nr:unnamed protein product [Cercospora beticola]
MAARGKFLALLVASFTFVATASSHLIRSTTQSYSRDVQTSSAQGLVITDCPSGGRRVALSFDDGPSKNVDDILAQLEAYNATATFFVNGPDGQDWTGTWEIAWTHANLTEASYDETVAEVSQIENWFANLFGFHPNFFRPPYGECPELCRSTLTELGYTIVNWNLDTQDWRYPDITSAFERMETIRVTEEELRVKEAPPIVLMHDPIESTAAVLLPAVLEYFSGLGYGFVSVAECLGTPREGWYRAVSYV